MKFKTLDRQCLFDVAIQTSGSVEAAFALSVSNNISISEPLVAGTELDTVGVVEAQVLSRILSQGIRPATEIQEEDQQPYGGIGYMGIETDFIVS